MPEEIKKTGEVQEEVKEEVIVEPIEPGQETPAGEETQTPSKKEGEEEVTPAPSKQSVSAEQRINRMYARLKTEQGKRINAENKLAAQTAISGEAEEQNGESTAKTLTEADVKGIIARGNVEKEFQGVETQVLLRHPEAINEDGTFNMEDSFVVKYIEIGKNNPHLITMKDGPLLAEAMAEKELGVEYKKGRTDEASRIAAGGHATTLKSTTKPIPATNVNITPEEHVVAVRFGMSDKEYIESKGKRVVT